MPDIVITDLRGGRNGIDSPIELAENQCVEALNVDWQDGPLGRKRGGAVNVSISGGTAFGGQIRTLIRHVPTGDETAAELWAVDNASPPLVKRLAGGTSWANVSLDDAITGNAQDVMGVTLNGKLFLAYKSAVDRLHVYDPSLSLVRRAGMPPPAAGPSLANQGSGSYAATLRYYRVRYLQYSSPTVVRMSEPSPVTSITPSGSGVSVRLTKPSALTTEHETHWQIEVSLDNLVWFILYGVGDTVIGGPIAVGTTTQDDSTTAATYLTLSTADDVGAFSLPTSARFLATDGNRLLMGGSFEDATGLSSRIRFTPVLGSADRGDDERVMDTVDTQGWVDLNEKDGGKITGMSESIQGNVFAFKYRQLYKLIPTGDDTVPYIVRKISNSIGAIAPKAIVMAEDARGQPVVAFLSHKGPYRMGLQGLDYLGRDVEDLWYGLNGQSKVNLEATTVVAHGLYYSDLNQIWWYLTIGSFNSPSQKIALDIRQSVIQDVKYGVRGGWALHTGKSCKAICSVMFSNTLGASMSRDLKPYISFVEP